MVGKAVYGYDTSLSGYERPRGVSVALVRFGLVLVLIFSALIAIGSSLLLLYGWTHNQSVFQGVTAAGADLGGLNQQQAAERISQKIQSTAPQQIVLSYNGQSWSVPASSLGITYDANATAAQALQIGHSGGLWRQSHDWLATLSSGDEVPIKFSFDDQSAFAALQKLAGSVTLAAQDARYTFGSDGTLTIDDGKPGVAIDVAGTINTMRGNVARLSSNPVTIQTKQVDPDIQSSDLKGGLAAANAMLSAPLVLTNHGTRWEVSPEILREMLQVDPGTNQVNISSPALEAYISQIADQVHTNGENAGVKVDGSQFVLEKSTDGESLDAHAATVNAIQALQQGQHEVAVAVTSSPATIADSDAQDAISRAQQIADNPLTLTWDGGSQQLTAEQMSSILAFNSQPDQSPKIAVTVNNDAISSLLDSVRAQVEVPAKDADLRYIDGAVTVQTPEQNGTSLDVAASAKSVESAISSGNHNVALSTTPVQPQVTAAMANSISLPDKLSSGATYYGGSVANRAFNVELAIQRVNGALIPPGGTFSFDGTVGDVDTAHGFKLGYGIEATSNGSVTTVPSVGGGICQVATTLFHAAFWAGMPIVQRSWHLYWIPLYGQAPSGITGLDATVDTDVGLDLKFKNITDNWLAVQASADGTTVRFALWGTDPGWTVNVDDPVVSNVVKADTAMQYEQSDQLAAGTTVLVEHAEDGFDVNVHRQVLNKDGKVIDDLSLKSHYVPSANVTLQGTG
ncbi:MAG: peptidoglycan binding domain-containing protein [Nitrolancea sp.]